MSPLKMKEMKDLLEKKMYDTLKAKHVSLENKHVVIHTVHSTGTTKPWAIVQGFFQIFIMNKTLLLLAISDQTQ